MRAPRRLRVAFLGNDAWSVPALAAVAESEHDLALVVTRPPAPGRRAAAAAPTPVASEARRIGARLEELETVVAGPGLEALAGARPDVLVVVAYGEILPIAVLSIPSTASVNVHFSLLPALRGASPVRAALLSGLRETGVSTIVMDEGLDTGDVLLQTREAIRPEDDAGSLGDRLARIGGELLARTLTGLASDDLDRTPQDDAAATYAPKIGPADRRLDWAARATDLANRVRAMAPEPGATASFRGSPVKVLRAIAVDGSGVPGTVVEVDREGFIVATGEGSLRVLDVAPAGRPRMTAAAFVNGFRPRAGEPWS